MVAYAARIVDRELDELVVSLPAISIEGARGVGKTETALQRASTVHRLDDPDQLAIIAADPRRLVQGRPPILIDEWQRLPESWDLVRRAVDSGSPPGGFLLTGSATPTNLPTHSGAGRIVTVRMRPRSLAERRLGEPSVSLNRLLVGDHPAIEGETDVSLERYVDEILASGFPGLHGMSARAVRQLLDGYISRIIQHDFPAMDRRLRNPPALRRWMASYAAATSSTASFETIRDATTAGHGERPARTTTQPYVDILTDLWIVDPLPAWSSTRNAVSRLVGHPKHHLVDPALAARLLNVGAGALLEGRSVGPPIPRNGTLLGALFESLVTQSVRVYAQDSEATVGHLRTKGGEHEVDLVVERLDQRVVAIEVKLATTVDDRDVRHLHWLRERLGASLLDAVVITTGRAAYRRPDGIAVVPAALLGP